MQISTGFSTQKDAASAVREAGASITGSKLIMFVAPYEMLQEVSVQLGKLFPGVPTVGTSSTNYLDDTSSEKRLVLTSFGQDADVEVGVIRNLSTCPIMDIGVLEDAVDRIGSGQEDTVCLEMCTGSEERLVTTMNVALEQKNIPLVGGTVFGVPDGKPALVSVNGICYGDAAYFALIRSRSGRIRTYSSNLYLPMENGRRHIATQVDLKEKKIITLDHRPAADVYSEDIGIPKNRIIDNVLQCPFGRLVGDQVFTTSMWRLNGDGSINLYKRLNENDAVTFLTLGDYDRISREFVRNVQKENSKISFVYTVNCIYRHILFQNEHYLDTYLRGISSLGKHVGVCVGGEQYKKQHVNQTLACVIFE